LLTRYPPGPTIEQIKVANGASCAERVTASTATVSFRPSAELIPFLSVAYFESTVDGELWVKSQPGVLLEWRDHHHPSIDDNVIPSGRTIPGLSGTYRMLNRIHTTCSAPSGGDPGVTPGKHQFSIKAVIPGSTIELQPATLEVNLSCDAEATDAAAGTAGPVPNQEKDAGSPTEDATAGTPNAAPKSDAGGETAASGCTITHIPSSAPLASVGLLALLTGLVLRKRAQTGRPSLS
jgi:hypothetical protein